MTLPGCIAIVSEGSLPCVWVRPENENVDHLGYVEPREIVLVLTHLNRVYFQCMTADGRIGWIVKEALTSCSE